MPYKKKKSLEETILEENQKEHDGDSIGNKIINGLNGLNSSKYFAGLCMIMLNIGSKYITIELSKTQQAYLKHSVMRQILLFSIAWIGTRDVITSLIITAVFIILTQYLFNDRSRLCMIPRRFRPILDSIDTNNDNIISEEELENAIRIIQKAKTTTRNSRQLLKQNNMINKHM